MDETNNSEVVAAGHLESGLSGDYELSIGGLVSEAWGRVEGNKGTVWMAMLFYLVVAFVLGLVFGFLEGPPPDPGEMQPPTLIGLIGQLVSAIILLPMAAGLVFVGVALARGESPNPKSLFSWYDNTLKLVLTSLLMNLLVIIGLLLLVLPGIYLLVSYQIALPLVVDKKLGPWQALEASRKVIGHNWFLVLGLDVVATLVIAVSMMLLGIPAIWTVPAVLIGYGILYNRMVGIEPDTLQRALS